MVGSPSRVANFFTFVIFRKNAAGLLLANTARCILGSKFIRMNPRRLLLTLCSGLFLFSACEQVKEVPPTDFNQGTGSCRLASFTHANVAKGPVGNYTTRLTYEDSTNYLLEAVTEWGSYYRSVSFKFLTPGNILATHRDRRGKILELDSIRLDGNFRVTYYTQQDAVTGLATQHMARYDGGNLSRMENFVNWMPTDTVFYRWQNGDMILDSSSTGIVNGYQYYTDQKAQLASPGMLSYFTWLGTPLYRNEHLEAKRYAWSRGGFVTSYDYTTNGSGNVTILRSNDDTAGHYVSNFFYECR